MVFAYPRMIPTTGEKWVPKTDSAFMRIIEMQSPERETVPDFVFIFEGRVFLVDSLEDS
jgi:hypothetical protein